MLMRTELSTMLAKEATLDSALSTARLLIESRRVAASQSLLSDDIAQHLLPGRDSMSSKSYKTFQLRGFASPDRAQQSSDVWD